MQEHSAFGRPAPTSRPADLGADQQSLSLRLYKLCLLQLAALTWPNASLAAGMALTHTD